MNAQETEDAVRKARKDFKVTSADVDGSLLASTFINQAYYKTLFAMNAEIISRLDQTRTKNEIVDHYNNQFRKFLVTTVEDAAKSTKAEAEKEEASV